MLEDFKRLWATNFLDNLSIEVEGAPYENGVMGKHVIYHIEERQRVKIVDYTGQQEGRPDEDRREAQGREHQHPPRLVHRPGADSQVEGVVRGLLSEKGFQFAEVTHEIKPMPGGPKLVHLVVR